MMKGKMMERPESFKTSFYPPLFYRRLLRSAMKLSACSSGLFVTPEIILLSGCVVLP
jgi:hypothetical protein